MTKISGDQRTVRRRSATRERLLDAARVVFAREGIAGASVEHICEQAGFTRGAFYSNYSTKDDLVLALFDREYATMLAMLSAAADPALYADKDVLEAVRIIVDRFLVLHPPEREWYLLHAEFELLVVRDEAIGREFATVLHEVRSDVGAFVQSVLEALGLRLTVELGHAATVLMGTYEMAMREAFIANQPIDQGLLRETLPVLLNSVTQPI